MRLLCVEMERNMAKKTEKELEIQRLDKKTPLQMFRDYVMITVASFVYACFWIRTLWHPGVSPVLPLF